MEEMREKRISFKNGIMSMINENRNTSNAFKLVISKDWVKVQI